MMSYAPIALFAYCRADKTRYVVESLLRNPEAAGTELYVFSDGSRVFPNDHAKTEQKRRDVEETRRYIHGITGFKKVVVVERKENWGLANSLIAGISDIIKKCGRVIVIEDDLTLSPYFLRFMNEALEKYKDDDRVAAVSGYVYPTQEALPENFFLRYFNCWGWATWDRAWALLDTDTKRLLYKMRFRQKDFDLGGGLGAYGNLYCQKVGLVDSWWVRLYASFFLRGKLTLYPGRALSENEGMDGTGTHTDGTPQETIRVPWAQSPVPVADIKVEESREVYEFYKQYLLSQRGKEPWFAEQYGNLKSFLRRLLCVDAM